MIFDIQRYSTHDGDGIRTLIFYKGCPLRCLWCSNPESQSFDHSVLYKRRNCKHFGDCVIQAPGAISTSGNNGLLIKRELIAEPEKLRNVCASRALSVSGESMSVEKLIAAIEKDRPFYRNDGGVTLSGGEPLAQGENLVLLLQQLHERRISTNMETSLHVKWDLIERTIGLVKTYLADLKHTDPHKFKQYVRGDASLVMENLEKLAFFGAHIVVRIPVIPGFNHSEDEIRTMVDFVSTIKEIKEIHFLPYHTFGVEKYRMLGMEYEFGKREQLGETDLHSYVQYAERKGFTTKIGG